MIEREIAEFGRRMGMPAFSLSPAGLAALDVERLGRLHLELAENAGERELLVYLARAVPEYDVKAPRRVLERCHYRHADPMPLSGGVHKGNIVLLTRFPERQATAAGKQVGGLETIAEQAGTFDAFSPTEQAALLDEALRDLESPTPSTTGAALVEWYVEGNGEKLAATLSQGSSDAALARKFEAEVLVKRNHRMADRIDALRRAAPGERLFVAVGALHLVGPDNLPQLLGARGYDISRVRP